MKNQLHCTTDWLFENSIISSSEAVSSKDARLLFFFVRRNYTHTSRTNVRFIKTRICACVRPKLLKQKKTSTDRAVILFGREIISMLCVLWQCCQPRFLLIRLKNDILYKSDKIYQKKRRDCRFYGTDKRGGGFDINGGGRI